VTTTFTATGALTLDSGSNVLTLASNDTTITATGLTTITSSATLGVSATSFNLGAGAASTIGTISDDNLTLAPNGTGNLVLASDFNTSVLIGNATTPAPLSISGGIGGNAALVVNQLNTGDVIAASASGVNVFTVSATGLTTIGDDLRIRENGGGSDYGIFDVDSITGNQTYTFTTGGTVWTSGNDGSGSGLDADTIDSIDSAQFLRSDTSDNFTSGTLTFDNATTLSLVAGSILDINSTDVSIADTDIAFDGATTTFTTTGAFTINSGSNEITFAASDTTLTASGLTTITTAATLGVSSTSFNLGAGAAATIGTVSDDNLTLAPNGTGNLILVADADTSVFVGTATTPAPLSISGGIGGNAALIVNQTNSGDILTASSAGTTRFRITNNGTVDFYGGQSSPITLSSLVTAPRSVAFSDESGTICIQGSVNCGFALGNNYLQLNNGLLSPTNSTVDFAIGGNATTSAKFAITGVAAGTPTATISAGTGNNAAFLTGSGILGTTNAQTLTLGNSTTGDIIISGRNNASDGIVLSGYSTGILHADVTGRLTSSAIDLASADVLGILPVVNGGSPFEQGSGAIYERIITQDFLLGGVSSTSAKFAFINVGSGTPTASISAGTGNN
ncbi:MAG: hypothetical protein Q7T74_07670, partial [Candidatus Saccharibacteria bacterium]|nr:hypothetical protein [Candidatus Saccharibacteria bacterium]